MRYPELPIEPTSPFENRWEHDDLLEDEDRIHALVKRANERTVKT